MHGLGSCGKSHLGCRPQRLKPGSISSPFMALLKPSPSKQVPIWSSSSVCSGILKNDGFEHVGNILRLVGCGFQEFEQFLDLDQVDGIGLVVEGARNGDPRYLVGFIFQTVDFHTVSENVVALLQMGDGLPQYLALRQEGSPPLPRLR